MSTSPSATNLFDPSYPGSRFFKCDLQLGTPSDAAHWMGDKYEQTEVGLRQAAEDFIRRCYEEHLEVIAITDHNFQSKDFIPFLYAAVDKLHSNFGYRITIFPGFEIEADVGKGVHVLALFEPDTDLVMIDHILTECGVSPPRFTSGKAHSSKKRLPEIIEIVQKRNGDGRMRGIVICPHSQSDSGIFDDNKISLWLQQDEFVNPDLLCLEVPRPVSDMKPGWQALLSSGPACDPGWKRKRSIACIMSSDAKALTSESGTKNCIGSRHTWIKMSKPSIEALRQAFLDHESRIRFGSDSPDSKCQFTKIRSLSVQGTSFLQDQKIYFSPNLTTLIGGRGTGKSTVVEYLRIILNQETALKGEEPGKNLESLRSTIKPDTKITVEFEKEGKLWTIQKIGASDSEVSEGLPIPDLARFFPVRVFSQREIYAIADDREGLTQIVENVARTEIDELERKEQDLLTEIRSLNQQITSLPELEQRRKELETERQDFSVRLERLRDLEKPLAHHKGLMAEERHLKALRNSTAESSQAIRRVLEGLSSLPSTSELEHTPNQAIVAKISSSTTDLVNRLREEIAAALMNFERNLHAVFTSEPAESWRAASQSGKEAYSLLRTQLSEQGTDPDKYLMYQKELKDREERLADIAKRIAGIEDIRRHRDGYDSDDGVHIEGLMGKLHEIWRHMTEARSRAANSLSSGVPKTDEGKPFVVVSVEPYADKEPFLKLTRGDLKDRRQMPEEDWETFIEAVLAHGIRIQKPPTEVFAQWVHTLAEGKKPSNCPWEPNNKRAQTLVKWLTESRLEEIRLFRGPDRIKVQLFRKDGTFVGELKGRHTKLSVGQRCTAVLALLLARGEEPMIIDQPEEDLDNEYVFKELVPLLRSIKEQRQVIVVSHNANIPVNGDAELIVAMEVKGGRGGPKLVNGKIAVGALDQRAVQVAVEEIMEGSEEAFKRRSEKYGF